MCGIGPSIAPFNPELVRHKLAAQYALDGHAGIVLHPRCLRRRSDKVQLRSLFGLVEQGALSVSLHDLALGKIGGQAPR